MKQVSVAGDQKNGAGYLCSNDGQVGGCTVSIQVPPAQAAGMAAGLAATAISRRTPASSCARAQLSLSLVAAEASGSCAWSRPGRRDLSTEQAVQGSKPRRNYFHSSWLFAAYLARGAGPRLQVVGHGRRCRLQRRRERRLQVGVWEVCDRGV